MICQRISPAKRNIFNQNLLVENDELFTLNSKVWSQKGFHLICKLKASNVESFDSKLTNWDQFQIETFNWRQVDLDFKLKPSALEVENLNLKQRLKQCLSFNLKPNLTFQVSKFFNRIDKFEALEERFFSREKLERRSMNAVV